MFKSYSLKTKLAVPIILITLIVLVTLTSFMAIHNWQSSKKAAQEQSVAMSAAYANNVLNVLLKYHTIAKDLGDTLKSFHAQHVTDRALIIKLMKDIMTSNPDLIGVWTIWEPNQWDGKDSQFANTQNFDDTGRFVVYVNITDGKAFVDTLINYEVPGDGDFYVIPKQRQKDSIIEPYIYKIANEDNMLSSLVTPLFINGKFAGVSGVDISLNNVQKMVNSIRPYETSSAYLISGNGVFVSHPDSTQITKQAFTDKRNEKIRELLNSQKNFTLTAAGDDDEEYLYTGTTISLEQTGQSWFLVVKTPLTTILADAKSMLIKQIVIGAIGLLLTLVATMLLASYLTKSLNTIIEGLKEESTVVTNSSQEVASASIQISEASNQQAASLQETVSSIEEISAMVARNANNASKSVENSERSTKAALNGMDITQNMINSIQGIAQSNEMSAKQMEASNKEFASIVDVINNIASKTQVINDIVFQTKLLSFNASVEAARAGESGKGFSVVAEEIGNLATMSGKAASEISALLAESVTKVTQTIDHSKSVMDKMINENKVKVEQGILTSKECAKALEEILENVSSVNEMIKDISHASSEQSIGIEEINKAMSELDQATQSSTSAAIESSETAKELMNQAIRLNDLVQELNKLSQGEKTA